jgi:hypothetical protein
MSTRRPACPAIREIGQVTLCYLLVGAWWKNATAQELRERIAAAAAETVALYADGMS